MPVTIVVLTARYQTQLSVRLCMLDAFAAANSIKEPK